MGGSIEARLHVQLTWLWASRRQSMRLQCIEQTNAHQIFRYVDFSLNRVRMLIHFGVTPFLVFDGDYLPSKAATETERARRRDESRKAGLELYRLGKPAQAQKELQKAVDVTPEMAGQLIRELKRLGVQYVVAPYEADAQLAYLEKRGLIQGVLSEDSDLLVFGVKCLLTKLDQYGDCIEINRKDFTACRDISLVGWSDVDFRLMAILSGCDYLPSISNMGLLTAYRMVRKHKTIDKILRMLQFDGKYHVPAGYQEAFRDAVLTFCHQRVFCPLANRLTMVTEPEKSHDVEDLVFIGAPVELEVAVKVARGEIHPTTKEPLRVPGLSAIPRTPLGNISRPNGVRFSDLKQNKSIETFFKTKRTPLAELDPNCFTPSPSQQRAQQRASGTWLSTPAPDGPSMMSPSLAASSLMRDLVPSSESRKSSPSTLSQPLKKRRLCSDPTQELDTSLPFSSVESGQSRFFRSKEAGPSLPKQSTQKRSKSADINIWSDDSIENVMADIQDIANHNVTMNVPTVKEEQRQVQRQEDDNGSKVKSSMLLPAKHDSQEDSQVSTSSSSSGLSDMSKSQSATSVDSCSPTIFQSVDKHVTEELTALRENNSCPPKPQIAPRRNAANLKVQPGEYQQALLASTRPQLTRTGSLTPLQRLGVTALKRSQTFDCLTGTSKGNPRDSALHSVSTAKGTSNDPDRLKGGEKGPNLSTNKGSEDLIIPDSEEESASEAESTEDPKLNLKRFAYTNESTIMAL